ncbi:MAG: hypothetical protein H0X40_06630 [Chthoniobacterales bacterium]|nr:hypothetical protein [Chthoniobacterales bacterium]
MGTVDLRTCLCEPIPEIFDAARYLDAAVSSHLAGRRDLAEELIRLANMPAIRDWGESLFGPKSPHKKYRAGLNGPASVAQELRLNARMPTRAEKHTLLERDGYHCRFCGIPVIRNEVRRWIKEIYPDALPWGSTNLTQHAAFQAMCVNYDHILPHARGGDSSLNNVVIACAGCNYGRGRYTLEEVGLIDLRTREPVRSAWDGLERFRIRRKPDSVRHNKLRLRSVKKAIQGRMSREFFLSSIPFEVRSFFTLMMEEAEKRGLKIGWTNAGFGIRAVGQPAFFYGYPPTMYKKGVSALEFYFAHIRNQPALIRELRDRTSNIDHVLSVGGYTVRLFVRNDTLSSAKKMLEIALDVMTRTTGSGAQRSGV